MRSALTPRLFASKQNIARPSGRANRECRNFLRGWLGTRLYRKEVNLYYLDLEWKVIRFPE